MLRNPFAPRPRQDDKPEFFKMAGGGNDFVILDNRNGAIDDGSSLALRICTRSLSVGADGLILVEPSNRATFRMRYYNADGSLADFCANGTRCAARFALTNVIAQKKMSIETGAGVVSAEVLDHNVVLSLPSPEGFEAVKPLELSNGRVVKGSFIKVGVPHYVVFLQDELWSQQIESVGRELRQHRDLAPAGANVNFVVVRDRSQIEVRTYERGVEAETLSCGSGVVASVVASSLLGRTESPVSVLTRSGISYSVAFNLNGREISDLKLTGDARLLFRARLTSETLEGFDPEWVRNPTSRTAAT